MVRWFCPTGAWVYASVAVVLTFIAANVDRNYQTDLWHHLARGREIVKRGEILNHDIFTCTVAGEPLQDPNWGTQVLLYEVFHRSGDNLLVLQTVNASLLAVTLALVVWHCRRASASWRLTAGLSVFTFLGLWQLFLIRPQTLSLLLFALMYLILDAAERGQRRLLILPPILMALWVNLHGAYPIGLVLIGVFVAAQFLEKWSLLGWGAFRDRAVCCLALCCLAGVLATFINPYGWNIYEYVGTTSATSAERRIDEWLPPTPRLLIGKIWLASIMLTLVALALPGRRPTMRDICLMLVFLPLSTTAGRMIAWWLIIAAPILAAQFAAALPQHTITDVDADRQPALGDGAVWGILVLSAILSVPGLERFNPLLRLREPTPRAEEQLQWIADRIQRHDSTGRIFSRFDWGEYLGWALTPNYTVFMDGRIEIFPDPVWQEYEAVNDARHDWQDILDRYRVTHLVLDGRHHSVLEDQVRKSDRWRPVAISGPATLWARGDWVNR